MLQPTVDWRRWLSTTWGMYLTCTGAPRVGWLWQSLAAQSDHGWGGFGSHWRPRVTPKLLPAPHCGTQPVLS